MRPHVKAASGFQGVGERQTRLDQGDAKYREDDNGRRFVEGVWQPRTGGARPTVSVRDDDTAILGIFDYMGATYDRALVVVQQSGKVVADSVPAPEWT